MYTTEMIETIVTSESAKRMIQRVTAKYGESYVGLWLFQVMGLSNDEIKNMIDDLKIQSMPQTATWSLPIWEEAYGIVEKSSDIDARRMAIVEKKRKRVPMNPARMEQIVSSVAGADVRIDEYYGKNRFAVYISSIPTLIDEKAVRKKLKSIKQTHRIFSVFYEQAMRGEIQFGGVVQKFKEIDLKEVK